jgi:histidine ammonia-lyase
VSGLPPSLVAGDPTHSGVGPLGKTAQSLVLEIRHAAADALELRAPMVLGAGATAAYNCVRGLVPALDEDRPLGVEVERLAETALGRGGLLERVRAAID